MIYILIIIVGIVLDRVSKNYAINNFIENPYQGKLLNLTYLENRGAAFGILQDNRIFFILLTIVIVAGLIYFFIKNYKTNPQILNIALAFVISGAIGNFYDRLIQGYVVDFLEFAFVKFPVFNVADIFVTVGSFLIIIYLLFFEESKNWNECIYWQWLGPAISVWMGKNLLSKFEKTTYKRVQKLYRLSWYVWHF